MPQAARRTQRIAPFHVMELLARARVLEASGHDIIHMEVGEPDFPTPEPIVDAAMAALKTGSMPYTPALGLPELRERIADFYLTRYGLKVDARRVVVTAGASGALTLALACLAEPGRNWLLADPGYPCNRHFVSAFEGNPVAIPVDAGSNFQPTPAQVARVWDEQTDGLIVASPSNPTGTLLSAEEIVALAETVRARNGHLIVDEIYHGLTYESDASSALAAGDDLWIVQSFSKYFQMTGWRLGWLVVPEAMLRDVEKLAQNLFIAASTPAQYAALAAFSSETLAILEARRAEFRLRRNMLAPALTAIGLPPAAKPQGAFYLYCDAGRFTNDTFAFTHQLLEQAGVAATPGIDFGTHRAATHLRFAYTTDIARLEEGLYRLRRFLTGSN